jgi:hypothetical protein
MDKLAITRGDPTNTASNCPPGLAGIARAAAQLDRPHDSEKIC